MSSGPDRRAEILVRSAELFAKKGIAATTVREIGAAADIFPGSLYHCFRSKDAIVSALLIDFMTAIGDRFAQVEQDCPDPAERVRRLITATLQMIADYPLPTTIYQNDRAYLRDHGLLGAVDVPARAVRDHWLRAIEQGVAAGQFRSDVPAEVFYRSVRDTLWATTHWPAREQHSTEEFAQLMIALFLDGFTAAPRA